MTPGQAARLQYFGKSRHGDPWTSLRPEARERWEAVAQAAIAAHQAASKPKEHHGFNSGDLMAAMMRDGAGS